MPKLRPPHWRHNIRASRVAGAIRVAQEPALVREFLLVVFVVHRLLGFKSLEPGRALGLRRLPGPQELPEWVALFKSARLLTLLGPFEPPGLLELLEARRLF